MIPSMPLRTGQTSIPMTVVAPIGGLNGRDPLANMDPKDAYALDNWLPGTASVDSRKGHAEFSAALGAPCQSLEVYAGAVGDTLLAFANGKVFDISTGVASEKATGKLSDIVTGAMFSNAADNSQHLILVTGTDTPFYYDGSAIADLTITGTTGSASTLNSVAAFKGRLYFGQRDMLGFYYLGVGAIQGAATYFDLGQVSRLGGYLAAIATFSESNSGSGPADYIVFITSKGEMIVYAGYDPSSADNWVLVGRYYSAPPIGRKCTVNYGTELVILTLEGALPFSQIKRAGDAAASGVAGSGYSAITSKLGSLLSDLNAYADTHGWQAIQYPRAGWLLLNAPTTGAISGAYSHYIMNTTTNAWTRITGWNGICFAVFNRRLYFGTYDGRVMLGDEGFNDDGEDIRLDCKQAYNYFESGNGDGQLKKHFQWAQLLVSSNGEPPLSGKFNVDYLEDQPSYIDSLDPATGAEWDTATWDISSWGSDGYTQKFLITLNKEGTVGSLWLRAVLNGTEMSWYSTQYVMQRTKGLLP